MVANFARACMAYGKVNLIFAIVLVLREGAGRIVSVDITIDERQRLVDQKQSTEITSRPYPQDRPFTSLVAATWLLAIAFGVAFWTVLLLYIMPAIVRFISLY